MRTGSIIRNNNDLPKMAKKCPKTRSMVTAVNPGRFMIARLCSIVRSSLCRIYAKCCWKNSSLVITLQLPHSVTFASSRASHFHCSPDRLGPRHIREYQAQLFTLQQTTRWFGTNHLRALRFFYIQTLKRSWSIADTPYLKKRYCLLYRIQSFLSFSAGR